MTSPTLSGLWLLARCPGSASLAHQRREGGNGSELGHAIHELLASRINGGSSPPTTPGGLAAKHDLAPDDAGRLGYLAAHLHLPVPPGALAEVSLGHWPDGHARRFTDEEMAAAHARGLRYPDIGQDISGTLDAMWAEPEPLFGFVGERSGVLTSECPPGSTLWVVDWKTGDMDNVPPVGRNWQIRAGALLAARWTGATRVIPAICYVSAAQTAQALREAREARAAGDEGEALRCERVAREGRWEVGEPLDAAALDAIEVELLALLRAARGESDDGTNDNDLLQGQQGFEGDRNEEQTDKGLRGGVREPLRRGAKLGALILGPHCERCGARAACPAFAAEALSLARHQGPIAHAGNAPPGALLASERAYLAGIIPAMRATLDRAEAALRAGGPVLLADGMVYGPALETVTSYRTAASLDRADADTTGCDGIADTGLDVAPVPQPHHWISDARIAYVVGLLHARHPWLCAAGITIDVMRSSVFNLRAHYCDQSRETYVDDTTTNGELDAWVTDLWRQFSIRHERVVFG